MNEKVVTSRERRVRVFRVRDNEEKEVFSHEVYTPGEKLIITLFGEREDQLAAETIFEVDESSGASFPAGGCGRRRIARSRSMLQMPGGLAEEESEEDHLEVSIWAGKINIETL